jgi:hypothetical protein
MKRRVYSAAAEALACNLYPRKERRTQQRLGMNLVG